MPFVLVPAWSAVVVLGTLSSLSHTLDQQFYCTIAEYLTLSDVASRKESLDVRVACSWLSSLATCCLVSRML